MRIEELEKIEAELCAGGIVEVSLRKTSKLIKNNLMLVRMVKKMSNALEFCAFNPATNEAWTSHEQLIAEVKKLNSVAVDCLAEVFGDEE